jgi:hypothetical protein
MINNTTNSRLSQLGLKCLIQVHYFYQHLCLVDSEVLRNLPLRQAVKVLCDYIRKKCPIEI